jgi:erythromycin esterase
VKERPFNLLECTLCQGHREASRIEPGSGFADLSALGALIGDAKVVGLGEANHGAHELFRLRHRLV